MAFSKVQGGGECSQEELTQAIIQEVRGMPRNRECCDCSAPGESQPMAVGLPCFLLLDKQSSACSWHPAPGDLQPPGVLPFPLSCCGACALWWWGPTGRRGRRRARAWQSCLYRSLLALH